MTQIGKNIKKIRNVKGLSQQAFADLFQLTRGNISSYEEFRAEPKIEIIIKIAHYFGIPLEEFISKDLSVNELLHYNTELVLETNKLKITQQLISIPYVPAIYLQDFIQRHREEDFMNRLPQITIPGNARFSLLGLEVDNQDALPAGYNFHNGDILIYEQVVKENIHRIPGKLGMEIIGQDIRQGIYERKEEILTLALNEYVSYPFDLEGESDYWMIRGYYTQVIP